MKIIILVFGLILFYLISYSQQTGTFKDTRDGHVYKTVTIGTQTWFAENLAYKTESGCWAYNNNDNNVSIYGRLYNWETAKTVCPVGWHLPSKMEWDTLINNLGGSGLAGGLLKSTKFWSNPNFGATNKSGFNALPAGSYSQFHNSFDFIGSYAWFLSSTLDRYDNIINYRLSSSYIGIDCNGFDKQNGYCIRCVKD